jgi:hypothetical protein
LFAVYLATVTPPVLLAQEASSVKLIKSVNLPGYTGDFDHFAVDYARKRLLLAAEDHGTLEVFDLQTSAHLRSVAGFGNPHSILVREGSPTVLITDSEKQGATLRDAATYEQQPMIRTPPSSSLQARIPPSTTRPPTSSISSRAARTWT